MLDFAFRRKLYYILFLILFTALFNARKSFLFRAFFKAGQLSRLAGVWASGDKMAIAAGRRAKKSS